MKVYVLIEQRPFRLKSYSSLMALIEDNDLKKIGASRSKLEKYDFKRFDYVSSRYIISLTQPQSTGDIRKKQINSPTYVAE